MGAFFFFVLFFGNSNFCLPFVSTGLVNALSASLSFIPRSIFDRLSYNHGFSDDDELLVSTFFFFGVFTLLRLYKTGSCDFFSSSMP